MDKHELRHLAFVDASAPRHPGDLARCVAASCERAALAAREAFTFVPSLRAFSWLSPPLDRLLEHSPGPATARACAAGARALEAAAGELGASLRVCGRAVDAPAAAPLGPAPGIGRTLLWFRRYGGRDEIVRAARRFLEERPGEALADGDLDAWLDTAGEPDPDLILYAGGPREPQDVLLWQGSYAEIWHGPEPAADFPRGDLKRAVEDYARRQRRFGR